MASVNGNKMTSEEIIKALQVPDKKQSSDVPAEKKSTGYIPADEVTPEDRARMQENLKKLRGYKKGGSVSSASKRADGCAVKGKTKGRMV